VNRCRSLSKQAQVCSVSPRRRCDGRRRPGWATPGWATPRPRLSERPQRRSRNGRAVYDTACHSNVDYFDEEWFRVLDTPFFKLLSFRFIPRWHLLTEFYALVSSGSLVSQKWFPRTVTQHFLCLRALLLPYQRKEMAPDFEARSVFVCQPPERGEKRFKLNVCMLYLQRCATFFVARWLA